MFAKLVPADSRRREVGRPKPAENVVSATSSSRCSLGLLRFPRRQLDKKGLACQTGVGGTGGCPMSSWDEEMFTMMGGLAAFAVFCIALLWMV